MNEIYKTFSEIGTEKEAYINWHIFCDDLEILCENINKGMDFYLTLPDNAKQKRDFRIKFLQDWRCSVKAINEYTRMVQNINYQTYQSPIYEIQTQIDTEKAMVAYREAMSEYLSSYVSSTVGSPDTKATIVPIIYPDISKDKVEIFAPFIPIGKITHPYKRHIICTLPSFEYLGRMYDLLPWILHESSHHIRVLPRDRRNNFLLEYALSNVFGIVASKVLAVYSSDIMADVSGIIENNLVKCMTKAATSLISTNCDIKEVGFEEIKEEAKNFLCILFPDSTSVNNTDHSNDTKKSNEKLFNYFFDMCRKNDILSPYIDSFLHKEDNITAYIKPAKRLLRKWAAKLLVTNPCIPKNIFIRMRDIYTPRLLFEQRIADVGEALIKYSLPIAAVKEYCFSVLELYKIMNLQNNADSALRKESDSTIESFLSVTFDNYQSFYQDEKNVNNIYVTDPAATYVLRRMRLSNCVGSEEKRKKTFCENLTEIFKTINPNQIMHHFEHSITIYREACADLLMSASLNMTSFAYCRQVLQTLSDTKIDNPEYIISDVNNERFKIVTAVLLAEEMGLQETKYEDKNSYIFINGETLIEPGITYCLNTLKCIKVILLDAESIKEDPNKQMLVEQFLYKIFCQIKKYLSWCDKSEELYQTTFLYILLHGKNHANTSALEHWKEYESIVEECNPIKYMFWRLEYFCKGLIYMLQKKQVFVPTYFLAHMREIYNSIKKPNKPGCVWETQKKYLINPKMDVGQFFNDPKLVHEKKTCQKLENTIDFIQNYYYYNRFKTMHDKGDTQQ